MIFACQHCGGIEPYIITAMFAAWGWGAWMLARAVGWLRRKPCTHPRAMSSKWLDENDTPMASTDCPDCGWHAEGPDHAYQANWIEAR